ncbi:MAG: glutathione S-transferase [Rhodospirillaceae bacterium]|nr:glutathione S-transferase [Rhodospirillaceae bacterium]
MKQYPILYSFRRCPYAIRGRMALKQAGIICELREVALRNKPKNLIALSPKGTVPVLELADGTVLDESLDIMRWALNIRDPDFWLESIVEALPLLHQLDQNFKYDLDRYKYFVNYPEHSRIYYRALGEKFLAKLEDKLLANNGKGICDARTTFADIAVFPFVRQFAFVDKPWFDETPYNLLKGWLIHHLDSELFLSVMHKYNPWKKGDEVFLFGKTIS